MSVQMISGKQQSHLDHYQEIPATPGGPDSPSSPGRPVTPSFPASPLGPGSPLTPGTPGEPLITLTIGVRDGFEGLGLVVVTTLTNGVEADTVTVP